MRRLGQVAWNACWAVAIDRHAVLHGHGPGLASVVRVEVLLDLCNLIHEACALIRCLQGRQFLLVGRALGRTLGWWIGQVLEFGRVMSLIIKEALALKEILTTLES